MNVPFTYVTHSFIIVIIVSRLLDLSPSAIPPPALRLTPNAKISGLHLVLPPAPGTIVVADRDQLPAKRPRQARHLPLVRADERAPHLEDRKRVRHAEAQAGRGPAQRGAGGRARRRRHQHVVAVARRAEEERVGAGGARPRVAEGCLVGREHNRALVAAADGDELWLGVRGWPQRCLHVERRRVELRLAEAVDWA